MSQVWNMALIAAGAYLLYKRHKGLTMSAVQLLGDRDALDQTNRIVEGAPKSVETFTTEREVPTEAYAHAFESSGSKKYEPVPLTLIS